MSYMTNKKTSFNHHIPHGKVRRTLVQINGMKSIQLRNFVCVEAQYNSKIYVYLEKTRS